MDCLVERRQRVSFYHFGIEGQQGFGYFAVYFVVIILVVNGFINALHHIGIFFDTGFIFVLYRYFQAVHYNIRSTELNAASQNFIEASELIKNRVALFDNGIDFSYHLCIVGPIVILCKLGKAGFLSRFRFQYFIVCDSFVHTDGILPVVAASRIFAGILNAHFVAGCHFFFQYILTGTANADTGLIAGGHSLFDFALSQVAAGASGEAHNHGIITFFDTFQ